MGVCCLKHREENPRTTPHVIPYREHRVITISQRCQQKANHHPASTPSISTPLIPPLRPLTRLEPQTPRLPPPPPILHHLSPIPILPIQNLPPPIQLHILSIIIMPAIILALATKQRHHILHREILDGFTTFDRRVSELPLGFLQLENAFFDGVVDGEAVDGYVDGLVEAVDAVYCLFFYELCVTSVSYHGNVRDEVYIPDSKTAP